MPLGAVLPFAGLVFEALIGGNGQLGHGRALRRVFDFGIFSQIADQLNPVQTLACHVAAPLQGFTITERSRWRLWVGHKLGESFVLGGGLGCHGRGDRDPSLRLKSGSARDDAAP